MPNDDLSVGVVVVEDMARDEQLAFNDFVAGKIRVLEQQHVDIRTDLNMNTEITSEIRDIVLLFRSTGEFLKRWGNRIRRAIIWITPIGAGVYGFLHWLNEYRKSKGG